jgi:hypothetical protein
MGPQQPTQDSSRSNVHEQIGLLWKTLAQTPTIRSIIPARIRSPAKDDFLCIGRDFIHLYEIEPGAHVTHIATKSDFDAEIASANVFGHFDQYESELHDNSDDTHSCGSSSEGPMGPQMLAFTLIKTQQLFFLTASGPEDGEDIFKVLCVPMPTFVNQPQLRSNAIAVDPYSRALAVAIGEEQIFVCYKEKPESLSSGQQKWDDGFVPVSSSQTIKGVRGRILLMDFLYPPKDDPGRLILLMIVLDQTIIKPLWVEWSSFDADKSAEIIPGHRILLCKRLFIMNQSEIADLISGRNSQPLDPSERQCSLRTRHWKRYQDL